MKKSCLLLVVMCFGLVDITQAQNVFPSSGNVGIGTTTPAYPLTITGQGSVFGVDNSSVFMAKNSSGTYDSFLWPRFRDNIMYLNYGSGGFNIRNNSSITTMFMTNAGNVGIGTASPAHKLDIVGDGINLENTTYSNQHGIIFKNGARFISDFNYGNNGTITTAGGNTFIGIDAGNFSMGSTATSTSQSSYNTGVGYEVLSTNTTGEANTAAGYRAIGNNTTGSDNTAYGFGALLSNTSGNNNSAIGLDALYSNTTGYENVANGMEALYYNTTGNNNTANGETALFHNTTGDYNTANGSESLFSNTTGTDNVADGLNALLYNTTGSGNSAFGLDALYFDTAGNYNTMVGFEAGMFITGGSTGNSSSNNSVFIGANTESLTASDNNEIVIGSSAIGAGSNSVVLGNTSVAKTLLQGNVLIGKTSQTNTSYKLDVNGNIRANQVTVNATGADYVFEPGYHLPSLDSLSVYLNIHHHLPGIAPAKQMQADGIDLGQNQTNLLKKIEELTLYVVQINHQQEQEENKIAELASENEQLAEENEELKSMMTKINGLESRLNLLENNSKK